MKTFRAGPDLASRHSAKTHVFAPKGRTACLEGSANTRSCERNRGPSQSGSRKSLYCSAQADTLTEIKAAERSQDQPLQDAEAANGTNGAAISIPPQSTLLGDEQPAESSSPRDSSQGEQNPSQLRSDHRNNYQPAYRRGPRYSGQKSVRSHNKGFELVRLPPMGQSQKKSGRIADLPFKVGDSVSGTIIGGVNGWRVALDHDQEILGFCPIQELPHILKDNYKQEPRFDETILGTRRNFTVLNLPDDMYFNGKGPRLSARLPDTDIIWQRARQMQEVCTQEGDVVSVKIATSNNGGILGFVDGLPLFIPWSYLPRMNLQDHSKQAMVEHYVGQQVIVSVQDVNQEHNRFVGNMIEAINNDAYARLRIGDLVWGSINSLLPYGAFVTLDQYSSVRALIHIANISQNHVNQTQDVFSVGERVRSAVIGIDQEKRQMSLSTAELETTPGGMLQDKEAVFENAEEAIQDYLAFVQEQRESGFPQDRASPKKQARGRQSSTESLDW